MKKFCGGLFEPRQPGKAACMWKTSGFFWFQGTANQALPQKQRIERTYSVCARLSDLNFGKMGF